MELLIIAVIVLVGFALVYFGRDTDDRPKYQQPSKQARWVEDDTPADADFLSPEEIPSGRDRLKERFDAPTYTGGYVTFKTPEEQAEYRKWLADPKTINIIGE